MMSLLTSDQRGFGLAERARLTAVLGTQGDRGAGGLR